MWSKVSENIEMSLYLPEGSTSERVERKYLIRIIYHVDNNLYKRLSENYKKENIKKEKILKLILKHLMKILLFKLLVNLNFILIFLKTS